MENESSNNILNLNILNELVEIMGDDMTMLINAYIEDSEAKLSSFAELSVDNEQDAIFRMAHSLKGSSRNVGVVAFSDYCEEIEHIAREGRLSEQDLDLDKLNQMFATAKAQLEESFL
jgi:histidine phosphotransfer protein HptB